MAKTNQRQDDHDMSSERKQMEAEALENHSLMKWKME